MKIPMKEIFVKFTCINRTPVYSKHKSLIPKRFDLGTFHCGSIVVCYFKKSLKIPKG